MSAIKTCVTCKHYVFLHCSERCNKTITPTFDPVRGHQVFQFGSYCFLQRDPGIGALFGWRCGPKGKWWEAKEE